MHRVLEGMSIQLIDCVKGDVNLPVLEKLHMGFLFYGHKVLQVECVIVKYKATRIDTSMTPT